MHTNGNSVMAPVPAADVAPTMLFASLVSARKLMTRSTLRGACLHSLLCFRIY